MSLYDWAIRVTLPFSDCSGAIQAWFNRAESGVCYEHEADEEVNQTHIHIVLFGSPVGDEQLKKMFRLMCHIPGKGNGFWSYKSSYRDRNTKAEVPVDEGAITYASKGILRPKLVKLFSQEKVEQLRLAWVEKVNSDSPAEKSKVSDNVVAKYYIKKVLEKFDYLEDLSHVPMGSVNKYGDRETPMEVLFMMVRKVTYRIMFFDKGIAPHATQYKQIASSAFSRLAERLDLLDSAIEVILKSWY